MNTQLWVLVICSAIGIVDTLYLIYHKIQKTDVACPFFPKEWCHTVQYSPQSKTFGIPNSVAGFFIYTAILILTLVYGQGAVSFLPIQLLVAVGFLFSLYFLYVQAFTLRAFCTWCVISAINFAILAYATFLL